MILVFNIEQGKSLNDCVITESEAASIMAGKTVDDGWIPDVSFGSEKLVLDHTTGKYFYSLISGEANSENPSVKASVDNKSVKVAVVVPDGCNEQDIITEKMIREADEKE